jgi:hypothetical protein
MEVLKMDFSMFLVYVLAGYLLLKWVLGKLGSKKSATLVKEKFFVFFVAAIAHTGS